MGIRADQYFWFDGVEDVDQANWGRFWRGFIPDGVIVGFGQNLMVSANSSGMHVQVATGEAMVYGVRVFVQTPKVLPIEPAEAQNRIDLIVCRAVFLNDGQSYAEIAAKKGIAGSAPVAPSIEQSAANIWEIPLAAVTVPANAPTISSVNVADRRVFFSFPIEQGGTGATSKAGARANLGITPENIGALPVRPPSIELMPTVGAGFGGYIDFHYGGSTSDFTTRIWEYPTPGSLQICGVVHSDRHHPDPAAICFRQIMAGTAELIPGVTALASGMIYLQYE